MDDAKYLSSVVYMKEIKETCEKANAYIQKEAKEENSFLKRLHLRPAVPSDASEINKMMIKLARTGNVENLVSVDLRTLVVNGFFSTTPNYYCIIAEEIIENDEEEQQVSMLEDNMKKESKTENVNLSTVPSKQAKTKNIGYVLVYFILSWSGHSIFLENLYVETEYRGKNVGTILFKSVCTLGLLLKCNEIKWQTLKHKKDLIIFYEKLGGQMKDSVSTFEFREQQMKKLIGNEEEDEGSENINNTAITTNGNL